MNIAPDLARLRPGLANPQLDSQKIFRGIMYATAHPGLIHTIAPAPEQPPHGMGSAASAMLLALADSDTPLWLDRGLLATEAETWLRFHCGCPITSDTSEASFAVIIAPSAMPPLSAFNLGDAKYPDQATTLIIEIDGLSAGPGLVLRGPGIEHERVISPRGLPAGFWDQRAEVVSRFQFGVDLVLSAGREILAIPRTTRAEAAES